MKQKKYSFIKYIVLMALVGVGSWQAAPYLRPYIQNRAQSYLKAEEEADKHIGRTTRIIPADADLGSYLVGYIAHTKWDIPTVEKYYEKVYAKDPENEKVESDLFSAYMLTGSLEKALPIAQKFVQNDVKSLFAKYILVVDLIKHEKYQEAIDFIDSLKLKSVEQSIFYYLKVWCYAGLKEQAKAFEALRSIPLTQQLGLHQYHHALLLAYFGQTEEAKEIYRTFQSEDISSLNILISMREIFKDTPEWAADQPMFLLYKKAIFTHFNRSTAEIQLASRPIQTPQQAVGDIFYAMACGFALHNRSGYGLVFSHIATYLDNETNLIKLAKAVLYQQLDMLEQANEVYATIEPVSEVTLYQMATNEVTLKNPQKALELFERIEKNNPKNARIQYHIAFCYYDLKQYDCALDYLKKAAALYEKTKQYIFLPDIFVLEAAVYREQEAYEDMFSTLEEALFLDEENPDTLNFLGYELIDQDKDAVRGLKLVQKAFEQKPDDFYIMDSLAWGYYKTGDYQQALKYAETVANKMSSSALANAHLGDIYVALERYREAETQYRKALTAKQQTTPKLIHEIRTKLENLAEQ